MTKRDADRLAQLAERCEAILADPVRQMTEIFRGDMRAIVAAVKELSQEGRRS